MVMLIRDKLTGICLKAKYRAILQKKKVVKKRKDKMDKLRRKRTFSVKLRKIKTKKRDKLSMGDDTIGDDYHKRTEEPFAPITY